MEHIRNFAIIAHIDHGKSTLADRLLELTGTVSKREMRDQLLDSMDLERERGITIKLQPVRMTYRPPKTPSSDSIQEFELNLIDTPGHVDFSYEVSRSLEACEGAILVVDAAQGIQAQTLANVYLAMSADLKIIPVLNKIDLPAANVEKVTAEVVSLLGCKEQDIILVSAKSGEGVKDVLEAIVSKIPPPKGDVDSKLRALIFDSYYDDYRGVVLLVRIVDGKLTKNQAIKIMAANSLGIALEIGALKPDLTPMNDLKSGEIGYIVTNLKSTAQARVGDTVTHHHNEAGQALPGYREVQPFVYAGLFPSSHEQYQMLKDAIAKLRLSDSALVYNPENSPVLGFGFRVGFLGLLHLDIVKERLEREYDLDLIVSNPSTDYRVILNTGEEIDIKSASELPDMAKVKEIREPWIRGEVVCPKDYVGSTIQLIVLSRGIHRNLNYMDSELAIIDFEAPLANLLTDFYDKLKSITSGYGTFNYDLSGYQAEDLVRIDFYIAGDMVEALSIIVHKSEADKVGRETVGKLKEIIPKHLFKVSLQAAIGGRFIAREDIPMLKKDVTGYLYGGDVSRKKKLWAKQARGKARLKKFGKVNLPPEAFQVMLKRD